ncbi:MAG TPA: hypothetical protein VN756_03290 [Solirubrobacterales bacterium]|nr:hypothetical protein [Solirubrobacterales bacterium]
MPNKPRLTYANIVSTLALFLALSGGAAFAASKIDSGDIAPGAVRTANVFKRAITSGKLAVGAVRSNQIADGAVGSNQIGPGAVGSRQIGNGTVGAKQIDDAAVAPSNLVFPVFYAASPTGGSAPVSASFDPYPLGDDTWIQNPGQIIVVFGAAVATLAYDGSGSGSCQVFFEVKINGQQVGGGEVSTSSTDLEQVEQSVGAQPQVDPVEPTENQLSARIASNGDCTPDSTVDSARFRVLDFG